MRRERVEQLVGRDVRRRARARRRCRRRVRAGPRRHGAAVTRVLRWWTCGVTVSAGAARRGAPLAAGSRRDRSRRPPPSPRSLRSGRAPGRALAAGRAVVVAVVVARGAVVVVEQQRARVAVVDVAALLAGERAENQLAHASRRSSGRGPSSNSAGRGEPARRAHDADAARPARISTRQRARPSPSSGASAASARGVGRVGWRGASSSATRTAHSARRRRALEPTRLRVGREPAARPRPQRRGRAAPAAGERQHAPSQPRGIVDDGEVAQHRGGGRGRRRRRRRPPRPRGAALRTRRVRSRPRLDARVEGRSVSLEGPVVIVRRPDGVIRREACAASADVARPSRGSSLHAPRRATARSVSPSEARDLCACISVRPGWVPPTLAAIADLPEHDLLDPSRSTAATHDG